MIGIGKIYDWLAWSPVHSREDRGFPKPTIDKGHVGVFADRLPMLQRVGPDGSLWSHPHGSPHLAGSPMKFTMLDEIRQIPHLALLADIDKFHLAVKTHIGEFGGPPTIYTGSIRLNPEITLADVARYAKDLAGASIKRIVIDSAAHSPLGSIDWDAVDYMERTYAFRVGCEPWPGLGLPSASRDVWILDVAGIDRRTRPGNDPNPLGEIVHMHMLLDVDRAVDQLAVGESIAINCKGLDRMNLTADDLRARAAEAKAE